MRKHEHAVRVIRFLMQEARQHDLKEKNQGGGRNRLHFAVAAWYSDSDSSAHFSAARLHLIGRAGKRLGGG